MKKRKRNIILILFFIIFSIGLAYLTLYSLELKKIKHTYSIIKIAVVNQEYKEAYMCMTPRFRNEFSFQEFPIKCKKMAEINANQIIFEKRNGKSIVLMYKKGDYLSIEFNKSDGKWLCDGIRIQSYPWD